MKKETKVLFIILITLLVATGVVFYIYNRAVVTNNNYNSSIQVSEDGTEVTDTTAPVWSWDGAYPEWWINVTTNKNTITISDSESNIKSANVKYEWRNYSGTEKEIETYLESNGIEADISGKTDKAWTFSIPNPTETGKEYYCWTKIEGMDEQENELIPAYRSFGPLYFDATNPIIQVEPTQGEIFERIITIDVFDDESGLSSSNEYNYFISTSETELVGGEWLKYTPGKSSEIIIDDSIIGTRYLFIKQIKDKVDNIGEATSTADIDGTTYYKFGPYIFKEDLTPPTISANKTEDTNWAKSHAVTITVSDTESGLADEIEIQYAWSASKTEEPTEWQVETEKSFTTSQSGLTGKYYLWVKPISVKDTAGNETTETKVFGAYYFDNQGPLVEFEQNENQTWKKEQSTTVTIKEVTNNKLTANEVTAEEYGSIVTNYNPINGVNVGWKIFYADESNIYLIADDYIESQYVPNGKKGTAITTENTEYQVSFANVINDYRGATDIEETNKATKWLSQYTNYASLNNNMKVTAYMLDTNVWAKFMDNTYSEYVIGGPTIELFVASYNAVHTERIINTEANDTGYLVNWPNGSGKPEITGLNTSESLYVINSNTKAPAMWLSSPSASGVNYEMGVRYDGAISAVEATNYGGIRPIVALKSEALLEKQADGTYLITEDATTESGAGINLDSIKYVWSQETPTEEEITQSLENATINEENEVCVTITNNTETGNDWKLWIYAEDLLGNSTIKSSEEFYLDNTAPKIEIPVEGYKATEIISDGLVTNYTMENNDTLYTSITPSESQLPTIGSRTIEMVFKLGESELENTLLFESGSRNTGSGYSSISIESNYLYVWVGNIQIKQYIGIYVGQEVHVVISVDESIIKLYINGKQTNQTSILSEVDWGTNNIKLSGVISLIRLYNRALEENEVLNNYAVNNPELEIIIPTDQEWKQEHNVQVNLTDKHSGLASGAQMQYGWSQDSGGAPTTWRDVTVSDYEEGAQEASFIATGSELSGKYYLWVRATELKDISLEDGNEYTGLYASPYSFWFKNTEEGNIEIAFSQNGNTEWAQTYSTTVTVTGDYDASSLKYQWTTDTNEPEESTFVTEFTTGQEISIAGETGELYLWILAKDEEGNNITACSNAFYLDNEGPELLVSPSKGESPLVNVNINVTELASGLKESNVYEYALINNFTGDLQTSWDYYYQSNKLEWKEYVSSESFPIGENLKGEFYLIIKAIEDNVGNSNLWCAAPEYTPITLGENNENVRAFGPYNFTNVQNLNVTMAPYGNTTWNKQQEVVVLANATHDIKEQKYLWTRETTITNEMLNKFSNMESGQKVVSPTDAEVGKDWYLWVYVEDIYGNIVLEKSLEFYIDTTVPTVEFTPNGNTTWAKSQTVEVTIEDDVEGAEINTETIKYLWQKESTIVPIREDITESFEDIEIVDGKIKATVTKDTETGDNWKLWIYVQDIAGNSKTIGSEVFAIDNTAPVAGTLTMKSENSEGNDYENNTWTTDNVYISVNNGSDEHSGHKSTVYSVNGGAETADSQTLTESGTYEIVVTTTDNAGNVSTNTYTVKITKEMALEITSNPTQMEYEAYEDFNSEGMIISITWDNGTIENTTDYTIVNGENLTCQVTEIEIQYNNNPEIKVALTGIQVSHAEVIGEEIAPTCTEKGATAGKYCEVCNITLEGQQEISELGHSFTNYVSNDDATCTADGTKTAKCERCDETDTIADEGSKLGHIYEEVVIEATCIKGGYTTYTCTRCQDTYQSNETEALGHSFTNYVSNNDATCEVDGTKTAKCERCAETDTIADEGSKLGHNYEAEVIEATCTTEGYTIHTCTICNENYTDEYTNALGHKFTNYISDGNATCEADGTKTAKCERCDETRTEIEEGSKKEHEYEDGICKYCGEEEPKIRITSEIYTVNDLYIAKLQPETTVEVFKSNIETNATEINIYNKNGELLEEDDIIATEMQLELKLGNLTRSFEIAVSGDINGDGKATILDMVIVNWTRLRQRSLEGVQFVAADVTEEGQVEIKDLVKINKFRLHKITEL